VITPAKDRFGTTVAQAYLCKYTADENKDEDRNTAFYGPGTGK
jgi:hypothetical protein